MLLHKSFCCDVITTPDKPCVALALAVVVRSEEEEEPVVPEFEPGKIVYVSQKQSKQSKP